MSSYAVPVLESPQSLAADEVYLISSGDLRQSANQVCWAAQAEVERQVTEAFCCRRHQRSAVPILSTLNWVTDLSTTSAWAWMSS